MGGSELASEASKYLARGASEVARSAAERAAAGVWGRSPQRGPGAEPRRGAEPPGKFWPNIGYLVPF